MLLGVGNALWFPSQQALLALIVTPEERPAVSAYTRASLNLGAALGGVIGGFLVHANTLGAFRWLFAVNVATYVHLPRRAPGDAHGQSAARGIRGASSVRARASAQRRLPPGAR